MGSGRRYIEVKYDFMVMAALFVPSHCFKFNQHQIAQLCVLHFLAEGKEPEILKVHLHL